MKSSDTPKKEGPTKTWNEDSLNNALDALRTGTISANKASKAFGIPSSTLYKIARREGIRLAAPFNAAPTTWSAEDLEKALEGKRRNFNAHHFQAWNYFFVLQLFVPAQLRCKKQVQNLEFQRVNLMSISCAKLNAN